jgi:hypothetical protein
MVQLNKERIALFTNYFLTNDKPVTVKELQDMFFNYCGEYSGRDTIYNDLESINMIVPLEGKRTGGNNTIYWSKART